MGQQCCTMNHNNKPDLHNSLVMISTLQDLHSDDEMRFGNKRQQQMKQEQTGLKQIINKEDSVQAEKSVRFVIQSELSEKDASNSIQIKQTMQPIIEDLNRIINNDNKNQDINQHQYKNIDINNYNNIDIEKEQSQNTYQMNSIQSQSKQLFNKYKESAEQPGNSIHFVSQVEPIKNNEIILEEQEEEKNDEDSIPQKNKSGSFQLQFSQKFEVPKNSFVIDNYQQQHNNNQNLQNSQFKNSLIKIGIRDVSQGKLQECQEYLDKRLGKNGMLKDSQVQIKLENNQQNIQQIIQQQNQNLNQYNMYNQQDEINQKPQNYNQNTTAKSILTNESGIKNQSIQQAKMNLQNSRMSLAYGGKTQSMLRDTLNKESNMMESSFDAESKFIQQNNIQLIGPQNGELELSIANQVQGIKSNIHYRINLKERKLYCVKKFHKNLFQDYEEERDKYYELQEEFGTQIQKYAIMMENTDDEKNAIYFKQGLCSLDAFIKKRCELNVQWQKDELLYIFTQLVNFTLFMYSKGYFHGDLKPQNIVLDTSNNSINDLSPETNQNYFTERLVNQKLEIKIIDFSGATQQYKVQTFYTPLYFNSYHCAKKLVNTTPIFDSPEERLQNEFYTIFRVFQSICVYSQKNLEIQQKFKLKIGHAFQSKENLIAVQEYIKKDIFPDYYNNEPDFKLLIDFMTNKMITFQYDLKDIKQLLIDMQQKQSRAGSLAYNNPKPLNQLTQKNNSNGSLNPQTQQFLNINPNLPNKPGIEDNDLICEKIIQDMIQNHQQFNRRILAEQIVDPIQQLLLTECYITSVKCSQKEYTNKNLSLIQEVNHFLGNDKKLFVLLGESGSGKTSFLVYLQNTFSKDNTNCHYFRLGQFKDQNEFQKNIVNLHQKYIKQKKIVFLLDGFDEIAWKSHDMDISRDICAFCFQNPHYQNKVIITGRQESLTQNFKIKKSQDISRSIGISAGLHISRVVTYYLCEFDLQQIQEFIKRFLEAVRQRYHYYQIQCFETDQQYYDLFNLYPELIKLSVNPLILRIILEILPQIERKFQQSQMKNMEEIQQQQNQSQQNIPTTKIQHTNSINHSNALNILKQNQQIPNIMGLNPNNSRFNSQQPTPRAINFQNELQNNQIGENKWEITNIYKKKMFQKYFIYREFVQHWIQHKLQVLSPRELQLIKSIKPIFKDIVEVPDQNIVEECFYIVQSFMWKLTRTMFLKLKKQIFTLKELEEILKPDIKNKQLYEDIKKINFFHFLPVQDVGQGRFSFLPRSLYDFAKAQLIVQDLSLLTQKILKPTEKFMKTFEQQKGSQNDEVLNIIYDQDFLNLTIPNILLCKKDYQSLQLLSEYYNCNEKVSIKEVLIKIMFYTKNNDLRKPQITTLAANAATIFNTLGFSFSGLDLSNTFLRGAILRNALMYRTNLQNADLQDVDFTDAQLIDANMSYSNLQNVQFGKMPSFEGHDKSVFFLTVTNDLQYCASVCFNNIVLVWMIDNHKIVAQYNFYEGKYPVQSIKFSPNGYFLIITYDGNDIKGMPIVVAIKYYWDSQLKVEQILEESRYQLNDSIRPQKKIQKLNKELLKEQIKINNIIYNYSFEQKKSQKQIDYTQQSITPNSNSIPFFETNITFSQNGTYFACVNQYGTELWKTKFQEKDRFTQVYDDYNLLQGADGTHIDISSNEQYIVVAGGKGTERVRIWNIALKQLERNISLSLFNNSLGQIQFSQCGTQIGGIFCSTVNNSYSIKIWSLLDQKFISKLQGHETQIVTFQFCQEGSLLVSCSIDAQVIVWNIQSEEKLQIYQEHEQGIYCMQITDCGGYLFTGSEDTTIQQIEMVDVIETQEFNVLNPNGTSDQVNVLCLTPKMHLIAGCKKSEKSKMFNITTGDEIGAIQNPSEGLMEQVVSIQFQQNQDKLLIQDNSNIVIYNSKTYDKIFTQNLIQIDNVGNAVFSSNQPYLMFIDNFMYIRIFKIINCNYQQNENQFNNNNPILSNNNSIQNNNIISQNNSFGNMNDNNFDNPNYIANQQIQNNKSCQLILEKTETDIFASTHVQISYNGEYFITYNANDDKTTVFDPKLPQGLSADDQYSIRVWNFHNVMFRKQSFCEKLCGKSNKHIHALLKGCHNDNIKTAIFSPDDNYIASGDAQGNIVVWSVNRKKSEVQFGNPYLKGILSLAFTPENCHLAAAGQSNNVYIWNCNTKQLVNTIIGHTNIVNTIIYSQDNKFFFTGSDDMTIRVYEIQSYGNRQKLNINNNDEYQQILEELNKGDKQQKSYLQTMKKQYQQTDNQIHNNNLNSIVEDQTESQQVQPPKSPMLQVSEHQNNNQVSSTVNLKRNSVSQKNQLHSLYASQRNPLSTSKSRVLRQKTNNMVSQMISGASNLVKQDEYILTRIISDGQQYFDCSGLNFEYAKNLSEANKLMLNQRMKINNDNYIQQELKKDQQQQKQNEQLQQIQQKIQNSSPNHTPQNNHIQDNNNIQSKKNNNNNNFSQFQSQQNSHIQFKSPYMDQIQLND